MQTKGPPRLGGSNVLSTSPNSHNLAKTANKQPTALPKQPTTNSPRLHQNSQQSALKQPTKTTHGFTTTANNLTNGTRRKIQVEWNLRREEGG